VLNEVIRIVPVDASVSTPFDAVNAKGSGGRPVVKDRGCQKIWTEW
jgi:hypothetical protein